MLYHTGDYHWQVDTICLFIKRGREMVDVIFKYLCLLFIISPVFILTPFSLSLFLSLSLSLFVAFLSLSHPLYSQENQILQ